MTAIARVPKPMPIARAMDWDEGVQWIVHLLIFMHAASLSFYNSAIDLLVCAEGLPFSFLASLSDLQLASFGF